MVATICAIAGDHLREWSPAGTNKYGNNHKKKIEHTTAPYCVIARNLPDRTNSNKEDLGTAGVILAYLFIINTVYATRTTGQPVWEKPLYRYARRIASG